MKQLGYWIHAARPKTLPAAAVPVMIGGGLADAGDGFSLLPWTICLVFALLVQVGTNYANDYYDFIQGADNEERIGPNRAVASGWIAPATMRRGMWITFGVAFIAGCCLIPFGGWVLLVVGIVSILCGIAYTGGPYPLGYNGLGEIFVFIFFGWIATVCTLYVQTGNLLVDTGTQAGPWIPWLASLLPGALSSNLLVVNNVRDHVQDRKAGKRTLAVRFGRNFGIFQYALHVALAIVAPLLIAVLSGMWGCLLVLLMVPIMFKSTWMLKQASDRATYQTVLEQAALILMGAGLLFSIGLVVG